MLLNAVDFYFVKNISGRYLVGLRWWTIQNADGITQSFRFEKTNVRFYCTGHLLAPRTCVKDRQSHLLDDALGIDGLLVRRSRYYSYRCLFSITTLLGLRLKWLVVASLGAFLSGYNLYAFMQAARGCIITSE